MFFCMLLNSVSAQVMIVGGKDRQVLTNRPEVASQSATVNRIDKTDLGVQCGLCGSADVHALVHATQEVNIAQHALVAFLHLGW